MDIAKLTEVVSQFVRSCPKKVAERMQDVEILICHDVAHAQKEMEEEFEEVEQIPADCKGVFGGDEGIEDDDEDSGGTIETDPAGIICLIASNISNEKEAALVLMHEMGHALGLDEEDVKALGLGVGEGAPNATGSTTQPTS